MLVPGRAVSKVWNHMLAEEALPHASLAAPKLSSNVDGTTSSTIGAAAPAIVDAIAIGLVHIRKAGTKDYFGGVMIAGFRQRAKIWELCKRQVHAKGSGAGLPCIHPCGHSWRYCSRRQQTLEQILWIDVPRRTLRSGAQPNESCVCRLSL